MRRMGYPGREVLAAWTGRAGARERVTGRGPVADGDRRMAVARLAAGGVTSRQVAAAEGFFGRLKQEFFHGRDFAGVTIKGFIERLDAYMTWYRDERIKLTFGTSIAKRRRELGLMA